MKSHHLTRAEKRERLKRKERARMASLADQMRRRKPKLAKTPIHVRKPQ